MSGTKEVKDIVAGLKKKGWEFLGQRKHIKMRHPGGKILTLPVSPSCHRAFKNIKCEIRKIEKAAQEAKDEIKKKLSKES